MRIFFKIADMKVMKDSVCRWKWDATKTEKLLDVFISYKRQKCGEGVEWKPEFGLSANIRDCLFCLDQRSKPVVKLFEIVAAIPLICTRIFRAKLAPSLFTDARKLKPRGPESVDFHMSMRHELHSGTKLIPE